MKIDSKEHPANSLLTDTNIYLNAYIKFGDAKAASVFVAASAVSGVVGTRLGKIFELANSNAFLWLIVLLSVGSTIIFAFLTAWHAISALAPRTDTAASVRSFPDIAKMDRDQYWSSVSSLSIEDATKQIANHNWSLAQVAEAKFSAIRESIRFFKFALLSGSFLLFSIYIVSFF